MIELKDLNYVIQDGMSKRTILNKVNVTFQKGQLSTITGPSGSGKTSLLYAMGGLLGDASGNIMINGTDLNAIKLQKEKDKFRMRNISIIFQNFNLFPCLNVEDNILMPHYIMGSRKIINASIEEYLDRMQLGQIQKKMISQLSGGEQQRVAIIRALLSDTNILLCDEPTASLDEKNIDILMDILQEKKGEMMIVIVTHDERVYRHSTCRYHLINGELSGQTS